MPSPKTQPGQVHLKTVRGKDYYARGDVLAALDAGQQLVCGCGKPMRWTQTKKRAHDHVDWRLVCPVTEDARNAKPTPAKLPGCREFCLLSMDPEWTPPELRTKASARRDAMEAELAYLRDAVSALEGRVHQLERRPGVGAP